MTSTELREKTTAAEAKVEKLIGTIARHKQQAEKKLTIIHKNGWDENDKYAFRGNSDAYWTICEYESKLDDIKRAEWKLEEAQAIAKNWAEKFEKQLAIETTIASEMPEIFTTLQDELADEWTQYDLRQAEIMKQKRRELSYEEFRKLYKYSQEDALSKSKDEFRRQNYRDAQLFIIDLYNRVKAITGEVTNWSNVHYGGKALNGYVEGVNGKAKVETIGAGGYNIQRYHLRVLVKEIK